MTINTTTILLFITFSFSLHSMDTILPNPKPKKITIREQSQSDDALITRKKSQKLLIKTVSLPHIEKSKISQPKQTNAEFKLLDAARGNNHELVELYIKDQKLNINAQDRYLNTSLHLAAANNSHAIISILLCNPQTDTSIQNIYGKFPHDLLAIKAEQDKLFLQELFAHYFLSLAVGLKAEKLKFKYPEGNISNKIITHAANNIPRKALALQKKQKHLKTIATKAQLPSCADKDFISEMLLSRLKTI